MRDRTQATSQSGRLDVQHPHPHANVIGAWLRSAFIEVLSPDRADLLPESASDPQAKPMAVDAE